MVSPVKEVSPMSRTSEVDESSLSELRASLAAIAKEVADVAERRTRAARESTIDAAEAGAAELRRTIRKQPAVSMAVAVAAGAMIALAVVPRFRSAPPSRQGWAPNITRADLHDFADTIQRSVSRAASAAAAPVTPAFERMVDALSRADTSTMSGLVDKMGGWFQKAQDKAKEKLG
jgi:hypothetical protein